MNLEASEVVHGRLGFANATFRPAMGMARGLALIGRAGVNLIVVDFDQFIFDVSVSDARVQWRLVCCYGPP